MSRPAASACCPVLLDRYPDRRFAAYGATETQIAALRARFRAWLEGLENASP